MPFFGPRQSEIYENEKKKIEASIRPSHPQAW